MNDYRKNLWESIFKFENDVKNPTVDGSVFPEVLEELSNYNLDGLSANIQQLRLKEKQLQNDIEKLAAEHYPVFLTKTGAGFDILNKNEDIDATNNALLTTTFNLVKNCEKFLSRAQLIESSLKSNAKALEKHTALLELVELPQLMQTSIQNGYYDDAIAILMHSKKLTSKHGADVPILMKIDAQVRLIGSRLVHQLCDLLRSPLTLPACIKTVVLLRRTGVYTEQELRLKFLQTRSTCLQQQLTTSVVTGRYKDNSSKIKTDYVTDAMAATSITATADTTQQDAYWIATRRIEVTRVQLFDIVTQYRAVFPEESSIFHHNSKTHAFSSHTSPRTNLMSVNPLVIPTQASWTSSNLFHCWLVDQITRFLKHLSQDIRTMLYQPQSNSQTILDNWSKTNLVGLKDSSDKKNHNFDGNRIATLFTQLQSLLSQTMHFGRSFARIGCDFRPHLSIIFCQAIELFVKTYMDNAVTEFTLSLDYFLWEITPSTFETDSITKTSDHEKMEKRTQLLQYPPLVLLYNQMCELFHGVSACCPVSMTRKLIILVSSGLHLAAQSISKAYHSRLEHEKPVNWLIEASNMAAKFHSVLVPVVLSDLTELLFADTDSNRTYNHLVREIQQLICVPLYPTWTQLNPLPKNSMANMDKIIDRDSVKPTSKSSNPNDGEMQPPDLLMEQSSISQSSSSKND